MERIQVEKNETLLEACRRRGIMLQADCGGNGRCGKCAVRVLEPKLPVYEEEKNCLTKEQLEGGMRLACRQRIPGGGEVSIEERKEQRAPAARLPKEHPAREAEGDSFSIAVDLGSTTLAAALLDSGGTLVARQVAENSQRAYGADVLSRIQAAVEGRGEELRRCICRDLEKMLLGLANGRSVRRVVISGNTVMLHLLRGYACEGLGRAPFTPVSLRMEELDFSEVFSRLEGFEDCRLVLLPGLSAFVGADIVSGLYGCGFLDVPSQEAAVFLDLGTNGEMAIGNRRRFLTASTAAGPAFEGVGLCCGVPGIPGAISQVSFLFHRVRSRTIGQKKPCGICGTGAIEAVAALREEGLMDENGLLANALFESGLELGKREDGSRIVLTQADIRQLQLAKAAIRAGLDTLNFRYRELVPGAEVTQVFVAGGFGYYLSKEAAIATGLFPREWEDRLHLCGNASLNGAIKFLLNGMPAKDLEALAAANREISLAEDCFFKEDYLKQMQFRFQE